MGGKDEVIEEVRAEQRKAVGDVKDMWGKEVEEMRTRHREELRLLDEKLKEMDLIVAKKVKLEQLMIVEKSYSKENIEL